MDKKRAPENALAGGKDKVQKTTDDVTLGDPENNGELVVQQAQAMAGGLAIPPKPFRGVAAERGVSFDVSDELQAIIGTPEATPEEVSRKIRSYLTTHNLIKHDGSAKTIMSNPTFAAAFPKFEGTPMSMPSLMRHVREKHLKPKKWTLVSDASLAPMAVENAVWKESEASKNSRTGPFSVEEDLIILKKVAEVAALHQYSTEDYSWLRKVRSQSRRKRGEGLWATIAANIPGRSVRSVYDRGLRLFSQNALKGRWSAEEDARLVEAHSKYCKEDQGNQWTKVAEEVGTRNAEACRNRWGQSSAMRARREAAAGAAAGAVVVPGGAPVGPSGSRPSKWADDEKISLKGLVEKFLSDRKEKETQGGMDEASAKHLKGHLRDNINWVGIAKSLGTGKTPHQCMQKWYNGLSQSLEQQGLWSVLHDVQLLGALSKMVDANPDLQDWQVSWHNLVPDKDEEVIRQRWKQLLATVRDKAERTFADKIAVLEAKMKRDQY